MTTPTWSGDESDLPAQDAGSGTPTPTPSSVQSQTLEARRTRARVWQVAAVGSAAVALVLGFLLRTDAAEPDPGVRAATMSCAMIANLDVNTFLDPAERDSALVGLEWVSAAQSMAWVAALQDESYVMLRDALDAPVTGMRMTLGEPDDGAPIGTLTRRQFVEALTGAQQACAETRTEGS
ncbi:MAG: hypothetical protein GX555_19050 [Actinomycetales bacterium]|nr:hypothetical protein [Actinomycetales bacterium]